MDMDHIDYARTARRMPWELLPEAVRHRFEEHLGAPVASAALAGSGFTHGFAAVLSGGPGRGGPGSGASDSIGSDKPGSDGDGQTGRAPRIFAKAAPSSESFLYPAYLREAAVLAVLPAGLPVPRLMSAESLPVADTTWQLMCFEAIDGYLPGAPWTEDDLRAVHDGLLALQSGLQALPGNLAGEPMSRDFSADPAINSVFAELTRAGRVPWFLPPSTATHLAELQDLVDLSSTALAGNSVLHNDLRADNVIIRAADSTAFFCDWNFLATGPAWADWVSLLPYARHGGIDVGPWLARSPLSAGADPEQVDAWLAVLCAYMVVNGSRPDLPTSPELRPHGRFTARIVYDWLAERRNWQ